METMPNHISVKDAEMLKRNRYILQKLLKVNNSDRKKILSNAPSELFQFINLIFRVLNDTNTQLSNKNENKIKKHRRFIQDTSDLKASAIKRKLKNQRGGFWSALLSTALPIITPIIKKVLKI